MEGRTQVMMDRDLAEMYQTETRTLKQAVKRNSERFPDDFIFTLSSVYISIFKGQMESRMHYNHPNV